MKSIIGIVIRTVISFIIISMIFVQVIVTFQLQNSSMILSNRYLVAALDKLILVLLFTTVHDLVRAVEL